MPAHFHRTQPAETGVPARTRGQVTDPADRWRPLLVRADRACCCPAPPAVVVILPPGPGRPEGTDLLLCRHHLRASRQRLGAIGAAIVDPDEVPKDPERRDEEPMTAIGEAR